MLRIQCEEYLTEVRAYADKVGLRESLEKQLTYLDTYAEHGDRGKTECVLTKDFAPHSFNFVMKRRNKDGEYEYLMNGGCIFHGPHDGGGDGGPPTFSVSLNPCHGWQIHT